MVGLLEGETVRGAWAGRWWLSGWSNAELDRLTSQADALPPTSSRRVALYRRAEEIAMQDGAVIPLVNPNAGILVRRDVHGMQISGGYLLTRNWADVRVGSG